MKYHNDSYEDKFGKMSKLFEYYLCVLVYHIFENSQLIYQLRNHPAIDFRFLKLEMQFNIE